MDEIYNDPNCVVSILSCKKISPKNESHKNLFKVNDNGYNDLWRESRSFHITYRSYNEEQDKVNICVKSYGCGIPMVNDRYDLNWECNFTFNKTFMANPIFEKHLKMAFDDQLEEEYEDMLEKQKMDWIKKMREEVIPLLK